MKVGVLKFLRRYKQTGTLSSKPGTGKASIMTDNPQCIIEEQMNNDDETPGCELQKLLSKDGITVCASTALRWRQQQYIERHQLLLTDPGGERGEVTGMGNKKDRKIYTDETTAQIQPAVTRKDKSLGTSLSPNIQLNSTFGQETAIEAGHHYAFLKAK